MVGFIGHRFRITLSLSWKPLLRYLVNSKHLSLYPVSQTPCCPRGSIYTTIMESGPQNRTKDCLSGPNSRIVVYIDSLGKPYKARPVNPEAPRSKAVKPNPKP